ncbi:sporulation protein YqfD [Acetivibrio mesophilus]|uniref:Sporulation protein YqfD n=1 Tax=Acetivibrio mesophilus TaxID=2487273 RepID=A0A4Q0I6J7_9FIRM|nr:sporulation protein YqfD [Acetivibrio mesophilus]RXE59908.1 sporulation protein YqfD [Acetivibrio mesophilus]
MLLFRLWNYIRGYVIIFIEGYFLEKFVNICTRRQILLWDIKRNKNSKMTLKISIQGFKRLRPIAKKTGCRVKILNKRGLPFLLNRYRRRKTFLLGAAVFIVLFYIMTSFVWSIEVIGNEKIETDIILKSLTQQGVKPGVFKYKINPEEIANTIILDIDGLSYVNVLLKGTKIKVEVAEGVKRPPIIPLNEPCDIVAKKDGVIKSIVVKAGQAQVKEGETVRKGQLLVSGSIPIKGAEDSPRKVHAMGEVLARTWYEGEHPVELKVVEKVRTGRKKDNLTLVLFSKEIELFHKEASFSDFEKVEIKKSLSIGEELVLPFGLTIERYYENDSVEADVSFEDAKENAANIAYKKAARNIPEGAEVVNRRIEFIENENGEFVADVIIECLEDIGVAKENGGE